MIANILIKSLERDRHQALTKTMDLEAIDHSQRGNVEGGALDINKYRALALLVINKNIIGKA